MGWKHALLLAMIALSAVVQTYRGLNGTKRTYAGADVASGLIEAPFMLWLLVTG